MLQVKHFLHKQSLSYLICMCTETIDIFLFGCQIVNPEWSSSKKTSMIDIFLLCKMKFLLLFVCNSPSVSFHWCLAEPIWKMGWQGYLWLAEKLGFLHMWSCGLSRTQTHRSEDHELESELFNHSTIGLGKIKFKFWNHEIKFLPFY